ncbi:MAG: hypothetical protein JKY55_15330 [Aliivibrio sp.]|uniref:hypothetical protein n=1 Tax=Aliivibrio sp. TaxID=1872443 RepID=UPI001A4B96A4|nr:hypothetical protein [Aliivibrio sp.]
MKFLKVTISLVAVLFGIVTLAVGTSVLFGVDPGYTVYRPLLIYNTVMGGVYVFAGLLIWRNLKQSQYLAAVIFSLNVIVLIALYLLNSGEHLIAVDSLRAMSLRMVIWLGLYVGLKWLSRRES